MKLASLEKESSPAENLDEAFLQQAHQNQEALSDAETRIRELTNELHDQGVELERFREDKDLFLKRKEELLQEFSASKSKLEAEINQKIILINEYQQTIADQRGVIEKKQKQLDQLETKVHDLTYEIKTLLQLAEKTTHPINSAPAEISQKNIPASVKSPIAAPAPESAQMQLKRCLNIAQKLTNTEQFNPQNSRFTSFPNLALDQRRLFESLQSENNSAVFVYSQKEKKFLFANRQVQQLLGWSPDKFIQIFDDLIEDGKEEWRKSLYQLSPKENKDVRLVVKAKTGEDRFIHCHMGLISSGIFRNHVIGLLYPDE